ncbi:MAG: twin-arginine translocation signal domain-containing protein [Limibaculum sp.]
MSDDKAATSRRDFLKLASVTAPAVAVVAVTGAGTAEAAGARELGSGSGGYRRTEHVEKYLESARF